MYMKHLPLLVLFGIFFIGSSVRPDNALLSIGGFGRRAVDVRGGASSKVRHARTEREFDEIMAAAKGKNVIVDFSASWCMPCKMISPIFDQLSNEREYSNTVFVKVDVEENPAVTRRYQVRSMPTFIFFKNSRIVNRFSGADVDKIKRTLREL
mmetsp:Transcript_2606/g.3932  ORF Transcript_2606/g.3932 Transcript_2606/m.3932 type:complete len:153 (-) Transcript_2606:70-528(-)